MAQVNQIKPHILALSNQFDYNHIDFFNKKGIKLTFYSKEDDLIYNIEYFQPDLCIINLDYIHDNNASICLKILDNQELKNLNIITISENQDPDFIAKCLNRGADDHMSISFNNNEMYARINAIFRRSKPNLTKNEINYKDIMINLEKHEVTRNNKNIHLGPIEFKLIQMFVENPEIVFTRDQIIQKVWDDSLDVGDRTVDVHINMLRKTLNNNNNKNYIKTIRSAGYSLRHN